MSDEFPPRSCPDWQLPPGVPRSIWELAHDAALQREDPAYVGTSPIVTADERLVRKWFSRPGRLIDLGCGVGRLLVPMAAAGHDCWGVDLSLPALELAAAKAAELGLRARFVRSNLCELREIGNGGFDYVLLMFSTLGLIQGASQRRQALSEARRIARDGAELALHVHNVWHHLWDAATLGWLIQDRIKAWRGLPDAGDLFRDDRGIPGMYQHAFAWNELRSLLWQAGWKIEESAPLAVDRQDRVYHPQWAASWRAAGWIVRATTRQTGNNRSHSW